MDFKLEQGGNIEIVLITKDLAESNVQNDLYQHLKEKEIFQGNLNETYLDYNLEDKSFLFLGLGKEEDITTNTIRKVFHKAGMELMNCKADSVGVTIEKLNNLNYKEIVGAASEGLLHSEYAFDKHLSKKKVKPTLEEVYLDIPAEEKDKALEGIEETRSLIDGIFLARDLVNDRAIDMYPEVLANKAKENLEDLNVKVDVYGKKEIEDMKMEAFLTVSQGSDREPRFIVMTYKGDPDSDETISLVGKGLTYDSGGYSLKPSTGMDTMFCDMGGAGTVIGAMKSIATSKLKKNVVGVVAACENMVSGSSYKPGDIIGSMSGKTIEVLNTDAEGRLVLADALWYAAKEVKADKIVDLATLTGACVVALGNTTTGALTNDDKFMAEVKTASEISGEPVWQLPSHPDYRKLIKSHFADINNTGGRGAGTITAGLFLEEFVDETPWVHLDIAGTAYLDKANGYLPKGATGVHVKTLYNLVKGE